MLRFGLHTLALTPLWDPDEAESLLPPVRAQGVSILEIPLLDPTRFDSAGTRAVAERHDMRVVCSLGLPDHLDVLKNPDDVIDFLSIVLQAADSAGAGAVSGVTYGTIGKTSGSPVTGAETDAVCRVVSKVADQARKLGMRLGIEPCNRYETHLLNTAAQAVGIVERTGAGNVFIHLDTYHMNIEEVGIDRGVRRCGRTSRIRTPVRVEQGRAGTRQPRLGDNVPGSEAGRLQRSADTRELRFISPRRSRPGWQSGGR